MASWNFRSITDALFGRRGINRNTTHATNLEFLINKPSWLSLSSPTHFRNAVNENPVLNGCISILAQAAANGKKYLVDAKGNEIPWESKKPAVNAARKLFIDRPNPLQSPFEFNYERYYYLTTFGNNYVFMNNPTSIKTDILTVQSLMNLNSEYTEVRQTGKLFDQVELSGIIEKYIQTEYEPAKEFESKSIIHFNELNTSGIGAPIMGTSRLQSISLPIENTQLAFEAMNVLLKHRGMQGIIKATNKDGLGTQTPLTGALKSEIDNKLKNGYGILESQKQFLVVQADIEYIKTIMSADEMGIYNEFSNNAMIISNALQVPNELYKTVITGATFENQIQAVRRLYQDRVIPMVENDDKIFTDRLRLRDYGLELRTSFEHIAALQESFKEEAQALQMNTNAAEKSYNANLITWNQYLDIIGLEKIQGGDIYKFERDKLTNQKEDGMQESDEKGLRKVS